MLNRRSPNPTEGDRSAHVFPVPFKSTRRYRSGARGGCLLMTGSTTGWNWIGKNEPAPALLTHPPMRSNSETMGSGGPVPVVSVWETSWNIGRSGRNSPKELDHRRIARAYCLQKAWRGVGGHGIDSSFSTTLGYKLVGCFI